MLKYGVAVRGGVWLWQAVVTSGAGRIWRPSVVAGVCDTVWWMALVSGRGGSWW